MPIYLENLVRSSNNKDYGSFTKDFSSQMLYGAVSELGSSGQIINYLQAYQKSFKELDLIRRDKFITVLYKQKSNTVSEFLGRLVLGLEGDMVKVFRQQFIKIDNLIFRAYC